MEDFSAADQQKLLDLILQQGIHYSTPENKVVARDGETELSWVMNFLGVSLHQEGLILAARQMLQLLERFEGKQLSTIGTAAVPLMTACILLSNGKYTALMVRPNRKAYGTAKLVDGNIDLNEPVIVIDDSIGSGTNMLDCVEKLKSEGLRVEGGACIVRFGYNSGYALMQEHGYHVETAFDLYKNFSALLPQAQSNYPTKAYFKHIPWATETLPDRLSPYQMIRQIISHYLKTETVLRPANAINQPSMNTAGGLWVSLRGIHDLSVRYGHQGFWHFPEEDQISVCDDLVKAAYLIAVQLKSEGWTEAVLDEVVMGISAFSRLEPCHIGDIDQTKYGLVVRSLESPWNMGGGLPNMPEIRDDAHFLEHVCYNNTALRQHEPFAVYRHEVKKWVEPNVLWPYGGCSEDTYQWDKDERIVGDILKHIYHLVDLKRQQQALPEVVDALFIPSECDYIFISVLYVGETAACMGMTVRNMTDLHQLVDSLSDDVRWQDHQVKLAELNVNEWVVKVSLLSEKFYLGHGDYQQIKSQVVLGRDSIEILRDGQSGLFLPDVATNYHSDWETLNTELYAKAGIEQGKFVHWNRYRTQTWLVSHEQQQHLNSNFSTQTEQPNSPQQQSDLHLSYLLSHQRKDGSFPSSYQFMLQQYDYESLLLTTAHAGYVFSSLSTVSDSTANEQVMLYLENNILIQKQAWEAKAYYLLTLVQCSGDQATIQALISNLWQCFDAHGQVKDDYNESVDDLMLIAKSLLVAATHEYLSSGQLTELRKWSVYWRHYIQHIAPDSEYPQCLDLGLTWQAWENSDQWESLLEPLMASLAFRQQTSGLFIPHKACESTTDFTARTISTFLNIDSPPEVVQECIQKGLHGLQTATMQKSDLLTACIPSVDVVQGGVVTGHKQAKINTSTVLHCLEVFVKAGERS